MWFFGKLLAVVFLLIWVRGTLPRLRMDQLMGFAWKFMLPMALANIVAAGVWKFMDSGIARWVVCAAIVIVPYVLLGLAQSAGRANGKRTYRYAN
jgi:NADH-quinone oxidoreductase subunit H